MMQQIQFDDKAMMDDVLASPEIHYRHLQYLCQWMQKIE